MELGACRIQGWSLPPELPQLEATQPVNFQTSWALIVLELQLLVPLTVELRGVGHENLTVESCGLSTPNSQ